MVFHLIFAQVPHLLQMDDAICNDFVHFVGRSLCSLDYLEQGLNYIHFHISQRLTRCERRTGT